MLAVRQHQHHRAVEVGVEQAGRGDEQLALQALGDVVRVVHLFHLSSATLSKAHAT